MRLDPEFRAALVRGSDLRCVNGMVIGTVNAPIEELIGDLFPECDFVTVDHNTKRARLVYFEMPRDVTPIRRHEILVELRKITRIGGNAVVLDKSWPMPYFTGWRIWGTLNISGKILDRIFLLEAISPWKRS